MSGSEARLMRRRDFIVGLGGTARCRLHAGRPGPRRSSGLRWLECCHSVRLKARGKRFTRPLSLGLTIPETLLATADEVIQGQLSANHVILRASERGAFV